HGRQMSGQVSATPQFKKIALIGFGLIGGSIARAAREQGLADEIVTTARSAKTRARVAELGIVDQVVETNAEAADDADLVILCIPVGACAPVAQEIAAHIKPAGLGAKVEVMTPDHHDLVLAITSHLPHLIAYTIVGTADELAQVTSSEVIKFSAGGFRDFTRIAASDPTMWRDVFLTNKDAVLEM